MLDSCLKSWECFSLKHIKSSHSASRKESKTQRSFSVYSIVMDLTLEVLSFPVADILLLEVLWVQF